MQLSGTQTKAAFIVIALAAIGLFYFLWNKSVPPEPTIPPGQSIKNPLGEQGRISNPQGATSAPRGPGGSVTVPAPGTVDPQLGMGPSQGARGRMPGTR
jgi:hypothetical protein